LGIVWQKLVQTVDITSEFLFLFAMNVDQGNLPIVMVRNDLEDIPIFDLPKGFVVRWFCAGDEQQWFDIQLAAEPFREITPQLFHEQFGEQGVALSERQCFLLDDLGTPVGTGTAWFGGEHGETTGRVHWMAIVPEFQGKGLGKALMTIVCQRLRELGYRRAFLRTSSARRAAIRLYRKFGFEPLIRTTEEEKVWKALSPSKKG
jgi:ribosomal protein S18 acetylase RimI-like enzyme